MLEKRVTKLKKYQRQNTSTSCRLHDQEVLAANLSFKSSDGRCSYLGDGGLECFASRIIDA